MKTTLRLLPLITAAAIVVTAAPALAFHDEGVAHCNGCHTMHNSYEGQLIDAASPNGNPWLLVDASPSDVCLNCHSGTNSSRGVYDGTCNTGHSREKGAGNYIYLNCPDLRESTRGSVIPGERAGHNIVAPGRSLSADTTIAAAPGGTFPSSLMGAIAYVRQVFSDAEHYGRANALYEKSPAGRRRPAYDRTLAPIHDAVTSGAIIAPRLMPM